MGDIVDRVTRKNKLLETNRPLTISAQYGLIDQTDFFKKTVASQDLSNYYLILNGEFAYNKSYSSEYPWGAIKRLDLYDKGALSSLYICFKPKDIIESDYLVHYFESTKWHQGVADVAGEGARNHGLLNIAIPDYFNTIHYLPEIAEQRKIADFLNLIEERIVIQNKVIEKYESLIKALCQILITSPNGTVCHIGDVLKIGSGKDHKHLNIGTIPVFGTGGYMLSVNDCLYEGESVCIGRKGTIDNPFFVDGKFWTVDTLFYTYDFNGVLPKFCYYLFRTINWLQYNEASGVPSLSKSTIERIQIRIPCMDEQAKAVQVLDGVEMEITCRRKLLNLYKSIKQYLISQLFI